MNPEAMQELGKLGEISIHKFDHSKLWMAKFEYKEDVTGGEGEVEVVVTARSETYQECISLLINKVYNLTEGK